MSESERAGRPPAGRAGEDSGEVRLEEVHLPITRRARLAVAEFEGAPAAEVWILLHGYRQLAPRFLRHFRALFDPRRLLVAPEGLSRFYLEGTPGPHRGGDPVGASWMTREDREAEIADYTEYLDRVLGWALERGRRSRHATDEAAPIPPRLYVIGFSQGAHTAARWLAYGKAFADRDLTRETHLVLWGASLPRDLPEDTSERLRGAGNVTLVRGDEDSLRSGEGEEAEELLLERWGVTFEIRTHPGKHRIDGAVLRGVADGGSRGSGK